MRNLSSKRRGHAILEFILLLPILATLLFGVLEFGQIFQQRVLLTNCSREGVRRLAAGRTIAEVQSGVQNTERSLGIQASQIYIEYNSAADGSGTWVAVADNGTDNNVPLEYLCRVRIVGWTKPLVTGSFFTFLPNVVHGRIPMSAYEVMVRGG